MMRLSALLPLLFLFTWSYGQFPGPAGTVGSTAMHQDSGDFIAWATGCTAEPGYLDIANKSLGIVNNGTSQSCLGMPSLNVLSLGDSGIATLTFDAPIFDGEGYDFAVFENAFSDYFLELAFVEVSSDGQNFVRFPATSYQQDTIQQGPYDETSDPSKVNNLAGKYRAQYGTPFDLFELIDSSRIDISNITHIRIIDAVGSIGQDNKQFDQFGNAINDPYPTDFDFGGFDLNAIGVINQHPVFVEDLPNQESFFNQNPAQCGSSFHIPEPSIQKVTFIDMSGRSVVQTPSQQLIRFPSTPGFYLVFIECTDRILTDRLVLIQ